MEPSPKISRREAEVLAAIGAHLVNTEIAAKLGISVRTVESHVSALLRKFGVTDRRALARAASVRAAATPADTGVRLPGLPVAHTSFVGRAHEVDTTVPALHRPGLVTLVGPGGAGKTRLACVLAQRAATGFADTGAFVDLVPAAPAFAVQTVAAALGVAEAPEQPLEQSVAAFLADRHALVVLDNCEHVLAELAPLVERILATCPRVTVLATSRERLGLPGERVLRVGPLPLASDAEALFADRARAADERFETEPAVVAAICARLDGLPLAIELAAARAAALGPRGLLAALDDVLRAVSGGRGGDRRHTSLRAVIEWSHRLLNEPERRLFTGVSVFCGSFDLRAVTAVADEAASAHVADVLGRLVDKCLILRDADGARWRMLQTIRAFADEQLDDAQRAPLKLRHLSWAADRAGTLLDQMTAGSEWVPEFDSVVDDLRAALASAGPGGDGRRLAWALARLTYARRLLRESVGHFLRAAELASDDQDAALALRSAGHATFAVDRADRAHALLLSSATRAGSGRNAAIGWCEALLTAFRFPSGFSRPIPLSQTQRLLEEAAAAAPADDVEALAYLDAARLWSDPAASVETAARAKRSALLADDSVLLSAVLAAGPPDNRTAMAERARLLDTLDQDDPRHAAEILEIRHTEWLLALGSGHPLEALGVARRISDDDLLGTHPYRPAAKMIPPLVLLGRFDEALALAEPLWKAWRRSGTPAAALISPAASCVALVHGLRGEEGARREWEQRARQALGPPEAGRSEYHAPFAGLVALRLAVHRGGPVPDLPGPDESPSLLGMGEYLQAASAELAVVIGAPDAAERLRHAVSENPWANACLVRARGRLDADPGLLAEAAGLWDELGARFERASTLILTSEREEGIAELRALGVVAPSA